MGINNLNVFLRKNCPDIFEEIHLSEYAYKKVAIDTSLFLCKYKAIYGDKWLSAFVNLVCSLRRNEVHAVFIYDNGSPPEKEAEKEERRKQQENLKNKVLELENSLEKFINTGELESNLLDLYKKIKDDNPPRLLRKKDDNIDINLIKNKIDKMKSNILNISLTDFTLTKELFDILKIPYYNAILEAETTCGDLCKRGLVDAVLSEDTDLLAYETPIFLNKIDTYTDTCIRINYNNLLDSLELTSSEFLDFCIMCGCDYNKNIPKIGSQTAFKYLKKYKTIENIKDNLDIDISILNHVRTREIFKNYEKIEIANIPFCGRPDIDELKVFLENNNLSININNLIKSFNNNIIIVDE